MFPTLYRSTQILGTSAMLIGPLKAYMHLSNLIRVQWAIESVHDQGKHLRSKVGTLALHRQTIRETHILLTHLNCLVWEARQLHRLLVSIPQPRPEALLPPYPSNPSESAHSRNKPDFLVEPSLNPQILISSLPLGRVLLSQLVPMVFHLSTSTNPLSLPWCRKLPNGTTGDRGCKWLSPPFETPHISLLVVRRKGFLSTYLRSWQIILSTVPHCHNANILIVCGRPAPPAKWRQHVHPEGARYFQHKEKASRTIHIYIFLTFLQHVFTDADLCDPKILGRAEEVLTLLDEFIIEHDLPLPESWALVIDLFYDGEEVLATYYYVDHQAHCIFFLDEFLVENLFGTRELFTVNTYQHIRKPLWDSPTFYPDPDSENRSWNWGSVLVNCFSFWPYINLSGPEQRFFVQLYPCCMELSIPQVHEFKSIILHHIGGADPFGISLLYKLFTLIL